jgi:hypothetical protein
MTKSNHLVGKYAKTFDTQDLPNGLYLLHLKTNKNISTYKIVKN